MSLVGYLLWGSVQGPRTALAGVRELPPGSYLRWDDRGTEVVPWWRPAFHPTFEAVEAAPVLRDALGDAIGRHLVADREVGLFLSGGVDSGAIANVAVEAGILRSLTVTFPEVGDDEGAAAARTASRLGLKHEEVPVSGGDMVAALTDIAAAMDQPTSDGVNSWLVSRAAHDAGLVVALSGVGGDELFGGYPSFQLVPRVAAATVALRFAPSALRRRIADAVVARRPGSPGSRLLMAPPGFGGAYLAVRCLFGARDLDRLGALRWIGEHDTARLFTPTRRRRPTLGTRWPSWRSTATSATSCCATQTSCPWRTRSKCVCRCSMTASWPPPSPRLRRSGTGPARRCSRRRRAFGRKGRSAGSRCRSTVDARSAARSRCATWSSRRISRFPG